MKKIIVVPVTCSITSICFLKHTAEYIKHIPEYTSLDIIEKAVVLFNDMEIHTEKEDLEIYWQIFRGKLADEKKITITVTPISLSQVKECYWTKKINDMVEKLIPLQAIDESSDLAIQSELLLKALNNFFVRAKANGKHLILFLNEKDNIHRFVKSILDLTRELYLSSQMGNQESYSFLPEVRLI